MVGGDIAARDSIDGVCISGLENQDVAGKCAWKSPKVAGDRSKWFTLLFLGCGIVILACDTYRLSGEIPHQLQNLWPDYGEKLVEYTFAAFMCLEMTYSLRLRR